MRVPTQIERQSRERERKAEAARYATLNKSSGKYEY